LSARENIPVKAFLMLNVILASLFFAGGYAVAYFSAPRTVIVKEQPVVYNNTYVINRTVIYNNTIPIENTTIIVINDTRVVNNTYVINSTVVIENTTVINNTAYVVGVPSINFTLSMFFPVIADNLSLLLISGSGRYYHVEIELCHDQAYGANVTELENATLTLIVTERTGESESYVNATVMLAMQKYKYGAAWMYGGYGWVTMGLADGENPIVISAYVSIDEALLWFQYQVEYVFT